MARTAQLAQKALRQNSNPKKATFFTGFFKTGPGEYGEGDRFIGVNVPAIRSTAKSFEDLPYKEIQTLLHSEIHEDRLLALLILVRQFEKADDTKREKIFSFYMKHLKHINNWDLVDLSAPNIVGAWLFEEDRKLLYQLAVSKNLWRKRISILATFYFIRRGDFKDTMKIAKLLLNDEHDLIHKAVGWMLREVGNRSPETELSFLKRHYKKMPRTMLRYAIEKFPESQRRRFLKGEI